jgi:small subunit ribosomal protein S6
MKDYELTVVLPEKATPAKKKSVTQILGKMVKTAKGKVIKTDEWGKIDLAYDINGNQAGVFLFFELELEPGSVKSLSQKIRLEDEIIRHLLVRKGK